jgi:aconitate hydratase 2/2-methylisocitrate dehydratase
MLRQSFYTTSEVAEEIKVVTYVLVREISQPIYFSPGNQAHSRSDRELHGKCLISPEAQAEIKLYKHNILIKV